MEETLFFLYHIFKYIKMMIAVIVGSKGQDGIFLKEHLLNLNYEVIEVDIDYVVINEKYSISKVDITDYNDVKSLIEKTKPDELYFLAAYHHSSEEEIDSEIDLIMKSYKVNVISYNNFLESIRLFSPQTKTFYASSCHIFGNCKETIQNENTLVRPNTIYALTKYDSMMITEYYRKKYNLFLTVGILYNHESHLRSKKFVSRKIVHTAIRIKKGEKNKLEIGNINSKIDWGFAGDYVKAFHQILSLKKPENFIISSGSLNTLKDFIIYVFTYLDLDWNKHVVENKKIIKRSFDTILHGDNKKILSKTEWNPENNLESLARIMIDNELNNYQRVS